MPRCLTTLAILSLLAFAPSPGPQAVREPGRDQIASTGRATARPVTVIIEFEALLATAQVSYQASAPIRQDMAGFGSAWSGDAQLFWRPPPPVDSPTRNWPYLKLYPRIAATGTYRVGLVYTQAPDFGNARVFLKGQPRGDLAGYAPDVRTSRIDLGEVALQAGNVECLVTVFGKDAQSSGFAIGLDRLEITRK